MYSLILPIIAAAQWTGLGLTVGDWTALATLIGSVAFMIYRLGRIMARLNDSIDELNRQNAKRDASLDELTAHVQRHDQQFIRDEERINQLFQLTSKKES